MAQMTPTPDVPNDGYQATGYVEQTDASHDVDTILVNRYHQNAQTYMLPVTSPDGFAGMTCAFVQLAAPTMVWVHDWTIMREGSRPDVPDPAPLDPDWTFLHALPELLNRTIAVDGVTPVFRLSGAYVYGRKKAANTPGASYGIVRYPRPPWASPDDSLSTVEQSQLKKGLSDTTQSTGGGTGDRPFPGFVTR